MGRPVPGAGRDGRGAAAVRGHLGSAGVAGAAAGGGGYRQRVAGRDRRLRAGVVAGRDGGAARGQVPGLLSGDPAPALGEAVITAETASWDDIGLGAVTDFVQEAFGPVDLDRSLVELTVTAAPRPGCPACAGRRFKFPADLADAQDRMCPPHRNEAGAVIRRRIARAEASNPPGWQMLGDASARLSLPHLPGGLATRLAAARNDPVQRARLLAEAAAGFPGRPDDFGSALAENRDQAGRFPAWPVTLIRDLGRAGQSDEAVMLSEALAAVDPARHGSFAGEAAVALAEAGLADDARAKIAENTERWPDDVRVRLLAGDALAMLGNTEAALAQFQVALLLAQRAKDFKVTRDLSTRMFRLTHPAADEMVQRRQPRSRQARSQRKGKR